MKKINRTFNSTGIIILMLLATIFTTSCDKDEVEQKQPEELTLSVNEEIIYTDSIKYSFDITSGGGDYQVSVAQTDVNGGFATLKGNRVTVDLVSEYTYVDITDKYGQSATVTIKSGNKSLQAPNTTIDMGYGTMHSITLDWGDGNFNILEQNEDGAADITFDGRNATVKALHPGKSRFVISDLRGTIGYYSVSVRQGWDLDSEKLNISAKKGTLYTFSLKYGNGDWEIVSCSDELRNNWLILGSKEHDEAFRDYDYDFLQIFTPEEQTEPQSLFVNLKDSSNNTATITINIEPN